MKRLLFVFCLAIFPMISNAQDDFVLRKNGAKLYYSTLDAKGELLYTFIQNVESVQGDFQNGEVRFSYTFKDKDGGPLLVRNVPVVATSENGVTTARIDDLKMAMKSEDLILKGDISSLPSVMKAGDQIKDSELTVRIKNFKATIFMTQRNVLGQEEVAVKDKDLDCYKLTEMQEIKRIGRDSHWKVITWYAKGVGVVRQELYDDEGVLLSVTQLNEIN